MSEKVMRAANSLQQRAVYEFGDFRLDTGQRVLESAGRPLSIFPKAVDVLIVLVENRGRIVEKDDLMTSVWPGLFVGENNLAFNISVLRKVLGDSSASPRYIETVSKRGYRFLAEVRKLDAASLSGTQMPDQEARSSPARENTLQDVPAAKSRMSRFGLPGTIAGVGLILITPGTLTHFFGWFSPGIFIQVRKTNASLASQSYSLLLTRYSKETMLHKVLI